MDCITEIRRKRRQVFGSTCGKENSTLSSRADSLHLWFKFLKRQHNTNGQNTSLFSFTLAHYSCDFCARYSFPNTPPRSEQNKSVWTTRYHRVFHRHSHTPKLAKKKQAGQLFRAVESPIVRTCERIVTRRKMKSCHAQRRVQPQSAVFSPLQTCVCGVWDSGEVTNLY